MSVVAAGVVAGASVIGAGMSANQAKKDRKAASAASAAQLAFEKEKYQDWVDTYGGLEDNLSEYYNSLTPDFYAAQGLEAFQKEQEATMLNIKTSLAQRGIEDSGLFLAMEQEAGQEAAVNRATIRAQAPGVVADEQSRFLQIGLGQNPGASMSATLSQRAQEAGATARQSSQAAGQAAGTAVREVGTALSDYINQPSAQPVPMAPTVPVSNPGYAEVGATSGNLYSSYDTTA